MMCFWFWYSWMDNGILRDKKQAKKNREGYWDGKNNGTSNENQKGSKTSSKKNNSYRNPSIKNGFRNKILCGSNVDILSKLPSESCNLVFGSPPYNCPNVDYDIDIPLIPYIWG